MKTNNQKGFTLIELMVVIGIIGIITGIAVPSFQRFQAKAKQANAKTELSAIYGMERAFFTEFGQFHQNLTYIGYSPDGVPLDAAGCVNAALPNNWPIRYYRVGFAGAGPGANVAGLPVAPCGAGAFQVQAKVSAGAALNANIAGDLVGTAMNNGVNPPTFIVGARGHLGSATNDQWTMNQNKQLINTVIGY